MSTANLNQQISRCKNRALAFLFPASCFLCRRIITEKHYLCADCHLQIKKIAKSHCTSCGVPFETPDQPQHLCGPCIKNPRHFDWHRSCVIFDDGVRAMIHDYKFNRHLEYVPLFVSWLGEQRLACDFLIPVPLFVKRLRWRTFNQSLELAVALAKETGLVVLREALVKIRNTPLQTSLTRLERAKNLTGAFAVNPRVNSHIPSLENRRVILVDDVYSTGSTLSACAHVLKKAGVREVGALTIAFNLG